MRTADNAFSVTIPAMEDVPAFTGNPPDNLPETSSARSRPRSAKTSTNPPSRAQSGKSVASSFSKHELNQPPFAVSSRRSSKQNSVAGSVKSSIRSSRNIDRSSQTRKAAELSTAEITSAFAPHSQSNSAKPSREGSAILRSKQQSNEKIASKSASLHFSKADLLRSASKNSLKKSGSQDVMPNSVAERFSVQGSSPFLSKTNSGLSVGSRIDDDDPAIQQLRELIKQTIDVPANDDPVGTDAWAADIVKQNDEEEMFEELCWEMARLIITEAQEELRQERESKKQSDTNRESKVDSTSSIPLSKASSTKDVARTEDQRRTESTVISKKTSTVDVKPSSLPSSQKVLSKSASKDDLKVMSKSASRLTTEDSNSTSHPDLTRASKSASKGNLQTSSKTASKENFLNEEPITTSSVSKTPSRTAIPTTDVSGEVKRASSKQASKVSSVPVSRPLSRSASKSHSKSASRPMSHHQSKSHLAEELIPEPESEVEAILRAGDPNEAPQVELQDNQQPNALNESNDERLILSNSDHSRTASSQAKIQRSSDSIHNSKAVSKRGSVISGSRASLKEGSVRNSRKELSGSDFIAENNEKDNLDKQENLQSERNDDQSNRGSVSLKPDLQSELSDKGTVSGDNPSKPSSKRHSLKDFTENSSEQPALELETKSLVEPELGAQETVAKQISVLSQPISKQASKIHVDGSNGEDVAMADPDIQRKAMKSQHQDSQILKSRTASGFVPSPAVNSHTSPNPSKLASRTISVQSSKQQLGETQVEDSRNVDVKQEISKMGSKTASGLIHEQDILQSHTKSKSSLVISRELSQHSSNSRSQLDEIHAEEKTNPENDIHEETDKNLRMGSQILGSKTASAFISPEGEAPASSTPPAASKPISRTLSLQHSQPNVTSEPIKSQSKQHSIIASEKSQIISEGEIINSPRLSSVDAPSKLASNINLQHSKKSSVADLERSISKQVSSSAIVTSTKQSKRGSKITISGDDILTNKSANGTPKIQSKQASKPISRSGSVISESRNIGSKSSVVEQKLDGRSVQNESSSRPVSSRASDSGPPRGSQENFAAETLESFKITERSVSQLAQSVTEDTPVTNEAIEAAANRDYDYATETDFEPLRTTSKRASVKELIEEHEGFIRSQSPAHSRKGTESVSQSTPKNASALASRQGSIRGSKPVSRAISQTGSILEAKSETHLEQRTAVAEEYENDYEDHNEFEEPVTDQNDAINHEADEAIASVNNEAEKLDVSAEFHQEEAIPGDAVDSNQPNEYTFDDFETHSVIGINTDTNAPVENHKDESAESSERLSENKPQHSLISEKQNSTFDSVFTDFETPEDKNQPSAKPESNKSKNDDTTSYSNAIPAHIVSEIIRGSHGSLKASSKDVLFSKSHSNSRPESTSAPFPPERPFTRPQSSKLKSSEVPLELKSKGLGPASKDAALPTPNSRSTDVNYVALVASLRHEISNLKKDLGVRDDAIVGLREREHDLKAYVDATKTKGKDMVDKNTRILLDRQKKAYQILVAKLRREIRRLNFQKNSLSDPLIESKYFPYLPRTPFGSSSRTPPIGIIGNLPQRSSDYFPLNPPPPTGNHIESGNRWWWGSGPDLSSHIPAKKPPTRSTLSNVVKPETAPAVLQDHADGSGETAALKMPLISNRLQQLIDDYTKGEARVGDRGCVVINGERVLGMVKYVGLFDPFPDSGLWCGIKLDRPLGKHDGVVRGKRYFTCEENHGLFVKLEKVIPMGPAGGKVS
ncbi:hypothetical protein HDU84_005150 [Entophlyctis sp. JEL0112]|nr:hypothetical protein HDU84_005150 [Entophlyctis sp. JEL0112]